MKELEPPDAHFVNAAAGWLELGLPMEAVAELSRVSAGTRSHPDVLALEWEIAARTARWADALEIAGRLLEADHSRPTGWINRSYALHELARTQEAHNTLLDALPRFPSVGVIPYNLACYACQMGRLEEARTWLRQAMEKDGRDAVIERARTDLDLLPIRSELDSM